uniref:Myosin light chain kinase family member 4 isoform X2 n=1 Tax=Geotrypetes seraphini TaxID=260995 RepID=A0A6P8QW17_GEOSA|nr:myosin light chain kinase family member 4 isoform X2 [Geotrypetes seraphini]XP_033790742.1 myosin light chain kinase family member 4 isoform X2 [Geotrypetes seraphini]
MEFKSQSCTFKYETEVEDAFNQVVTGELKQKMKKLLKVNRLEENNARYNSTRLSKIDFYHCLERVGIMRSFWEERSSESESGTENEEVPYQKLCFPLRDAIKDQKAKDKNEESSLEFKETKILTKKKLPGSTERSVQKSQSFSHKERVIKLNKENAGNVNTLLTYSNTTKGYAQVPKEEEPELHLAAALDGTKDVLHKQQSHEEAKVHQKMVVQDVEKSQQALGSDKSHLKEEVIEEEEELEDEREDETVEEESESVLETDKEVKGDVGPDECQDQGIAAEDISKSSGGDRPGKELKPTKTVTEEFNKNSTQLLQRYDDGKENVPMSQRPNNEMSVEFLQGVGQNGCECAISSKRRVTEEDLVKDDSKKSKVEKEAAKNIVNSKTEDAPLISKDSPEVPDSLKDNQPEPSKVDKKPQILIDISPAPPAPFGHRIVSAKHAQVNSFYTVSKTNVLGGGRFGQVHQCVEKASGLTLAAKIIKARGLKEKEEVKNEIYVMNQLNHVNLLQLYDAFESKSDIVLIMEFVAGGELFDRIISENYNLTELDTILFIKQICEGIQYMHQMYFLHLDLKPENIMCVNQAANQIKIIDFGLARRYKPREKLKVNFGTPEFLAPEVVNYDFVSFPTDMWSIGVITYMLLSGLSPFLGEDDNETLNNIVACDWDFEDESFHDVSEEAKDFITKLLIKEKCWRISATETLKHPWLSDQKLRYRLGHQRKTKVSSVSRTPKTQ